MMKLLLLISALFVAAAVVTAVPVEPSDDETDNRNDGSMEDPQIAVDEPDNSDDGSMEDPQIAVDEPDNNDDGSMEDPQIAVDETDNSDDGSMEDPQIEVDETDSSDDGSTEDPQIDVDETQVDVTDLINDMARLHEDAIDVIQQVETTLFTLQSLLPHSIRKRQTTIHGSASRGPGGSNWNVGVKKTFNKGRTSFGANFGRSSGGGKSGGFTFSHKFGKRR